MAAIMPSSSLNFMPPLVQPNGHHSGGQEANTESFPWQYEHASVLLSLQPVPESLLEEPSPLGLTLRKSQSLLELISSKLSQDGSQAQTLEPVEETTEASEVVTLDRNPWQRGAYKPKHSVLYASGPLAVTDVVSVAKRTASSGSVPFNGTLTVAPVNYYAHGHDKVKASNFACSTITIGTWERKSRYEGDLVAKCYYAKRKLVWEVLENGLKSKLEIQWGDISFMRASCPENAAGVLEIEVSRPPLFFEETNPQPRKHTVWQAASDFTGGQASTSRHHVLTFAEGVLNKPYEKLLQCDPRLRSLVEGSMPICHPPHVAPQQTPSPPPAMPYDPSLTPSPPPYAHHAPDQSQSQSQSHYHYQHPSGHWQVHPAYDAHQHYAPHQLLGYHVYPPAAVAPATRGSHYRSSRVSHGPPFPSAHGHPSYSHPGMAVGEADAAMLPQMLHYDRHHHSYGVESHGTSDAGSGTASADGSSDDDTELLQEEMAAGGGHFDPMDIIHSAPPHRSQDYRPPLVPHSTAAAAIPRPPHSSHLRSHGHSGMSQRPHAHLHTQPNALPHLHPSAHPQAHVHPHAHGHPLPMPRGHPHMNPHGHPHYTPSPSADLSSHPGHIHPPTSSMPYTSALTPSPPPMTAAMVMEPTGSFRGMHMATASGGEGEHLSHFEDLLTEAEMAMEYNGGYVPEAHVVAPSGSAMGGMIHPGMSTVQQSHMSMQGIAAMPAGSMSNYQYPPGHHYAHGHHLQGHPSAHSSAHPAAMLPPHHSAAMAPVSLMPGEPAAAAYGLSNGAPKMGVYPTAAPVRGRGRPRIDAAPSPSTAKGYSHASLTYSHPPQPPQPTVAPPSLLVHSSSSTGSTVTEQQPQSLPAHLLHPPYTSLQPPPPAPRSSSSPLAPAHVSEGFSAARVDVKWEGGSVGQRSPSVKRTWVRNGPMLPGSGLLPQPVSQSYSQSEAPLLDVSELAPCEPTGPSSVTAVRGTEGTTSSCSHEPSHSQSGGGSLAPDAAGGDVLLHLPRMNSVPMFV